MSNSTRQQSSSKRTSSSTTPKALLSFVEQPPSAASSPSVPHPSSIPSTPTSSPELDLLPTVPDLSPQPPTLPTIVARLQNSVEDEDFESEEPEQEHCNTKKRPDDMASSISSPIAPLGRRRALWNSKSKELMLSTEDIPQTYLDTSGLLISDEPVKPESEPVPRSTIAQSESIPTRRSKNSEPAKALTPQPLKKPPAKRGFFSRLLTPELNKQSLRESASSPQDNKGRTSPTESSPREISPRDLSSMSSSSLPLVDLLPITSVEVVKVDLLSEVNKPDIQSTTTDEDSIPKAQKRQSLRFSWRPSPPDSPEEVKQPAQPAQCDTQADQETQEKNEPTPQPNNTETRTEYKKKLVVPATPERRVSLLHDLDRQNWRLKKDNAEMKMENCHLFKELDILNRRIIMRYRPELLRASIATLNKSQIFQYTIDATMSYSKSLNSFLEQYYIDFPEVKALVAIFMRGRDQQASVSIRSDRGSRIAARSASTKRRPSISIRSGLPGPKITDSAPSTPQQTPHNSKHVLLHMFDSNEDAELAKWQQDVSMLREEDILAEDPIEQRRASISGGLDPMTTRSAVTSEDGKIVDDFAKPCIINRQFARDVPSLIRINGKPPSGRTDNEKSVNAYSTLMKETKNDAKFVSLIMQLANQNLGIVVYEKLVKHFWEMGLVVKQSWQHYLDIILNPVLPQPDRTGSSTLGLPLVELGKDCIRANVVGTQQHASTELPQQQLEDGPDRTREFSTAIIYMLAIFRLENAEDSESIPPLFVKGTIELFLDSRAIHVGISASSMGNSASQQNLSDTEENESGTATDDAELIDSPRQDVDADSQPPSQPVESRSPNAFVEDEVRVIYSTPTFDITAFLHSIDLPL
eukprot:TRINITY_DN3335_c0_g1_i1.p1 TRINITY_DN3335_c0_g1~~TRINITY_DN3335_c0_g1_i1.p1  ORF type:complete len:866 (-),score=135.46 TRINITY_DN3335_c0_g1_i1:127-2724(-)